ncbi:DUF4158 domain-containing protein [Candidatus Tisiphia endosymbiont of Metellina segmentata]|uniref:DUF4158 domain-containing protein n=1 Tax=Candidatus Tisiphia endosymbiont of Metellina segmentata TaxID=3066274 RepID=UPI0039779A53
MKLYRPFARNFVPSCKDPQRREYFSFSESEIVNITSSLHTHINVFYALQLGYFKAKKIFFQLSWEDIPQEDLQFIIYHYFDDKNGSVASINHTTARLLKPPASAGKDFSPCSNISIHYNLNI